MIPSIEHEVMLHAIDPDRNNRSYERLCDLISRGIDKECLINMAVKEGLVCLLYKNLKRSDRLKAFSPDQTERLQTLYHQTMAFNLRLISDLKKILIQFNKNNIKVVLLQGMALLELVYKKDIGLRPMTDIDFWVLKKHYNSMIDVLLGHGFKRDPLYPNTFTKGSTILDIHTHLLWADRIKTRRWLIAKDQEYLYDNARIIRIEGQKVLCLSRTDQIIYLSMHALKHNMDRLIWLVDIRSLLANFEINDWKRLIDRAGDLGQERVLTFIFYLLKHLFDFVPPEQIKYNMKKREPNSLEKKALIQRANGHSIPLWGRFILLSPAGGKVKHILYILETMFPGQEVLRQVFAGFPEIKTWRLYWMRLIQILLTVKSNLKRY